jgi:photosystem II stability/assembly factor-like uncharacterized protein
MKYLYTNLKTSFLTLLLFLICTSAKSQQWQNITPAGYNYFSTASFINDKEGWIFARYGEWPNAHYKLLHTTDGATTFTPIFSLPDTLIIWNLQMVDSLNGFARVDENPSDGLYLWATYDGGYSWIDITDTSMANPIGALHESRGTFFIDKNIGFLGGANSIYKTIDGGITWDKMNTPTIIDSTSSNLYSPNKIFFYNELYGWAACSLLWDNGFVLKTTDCGQNWSVCEPITGDLFNIHFADSLHGGTTGGSWYSGIVMLTDNNFDTISNFYMNQWEQLPDAIYYQTYSTIWMSGWPAVIYKSTDGGASFVEYDTTYATDNQTDWLHDFQFFDSTGYAFAYSFILRYVDTLNTPIMNPISMNNNVLIVPNPANSEINISFVSHNTGNSSVELYSVNGVLVSSIEKFINIGKNEFLLNISNLTPGMYLLKIGKNSTGYNSKLIKQP